MSGDLHANGAGDSRPLPPAFTQPPRRPTAAGAVANRPRPPFFRSTAGDEAWVREHAQPTGAYGPDSTGPEPADGEFGYDAAPELEQPPAAPAESSAPAGLEVAIFEPPAEEGESAAPAGLEVGIFEPPAGEAKSGAPAGLEVGIFEPPAEEAEFAAPAGFEPDTLAPPEPAPAPLGAGPTAPAETATFSRPHVPSPPPGASAERAGFAGLPSDAVFLPDAEIPRRPQGEKQVLPDFHEPMRRPATAASNPAILVAARLELLARRLRERGGAGLTESFSGDTLDLALAGFISGYLAGRGS